jgi:hypothetical protein
VRLAIWHAWSCDLLFAFFLIRLGHAIMAGCSGVLEWLITGVFAKVGVLGS